MVRKTRSYLVGIIALFASGAVSSAETPRIIGYYTSWSVYERNYHVADIPAESVDVINYAFANIENGRIVLGDPYADTERWYEGDSWNPDSLRGCFHQLQLLKARYPHIQTLISVGGWTWSTYFSDVALTEESRALFAASCVEFVEQYGFDGVDIDWEYPVSGGLPDNITRPEDKENFTLLLAELRGRLDQAGDYLLTIAASASPFIIDNVEVDAIHGYLDWINLMTYDFHGPWGGDGDPVTNFNAPLHPASDDPLDEPFHSQFNLAASVGAYVESGVPTRKLSAGLAFYGRGFGQVDSQADGLFASYGGPAGGGTWESGVFDYWDLAENYIGLNGYTAYRHDEARVPWLYNPGAQVMITYDDPASIEEKGRYIVAAELGGAMFWEFAADREGDLLAAAFGTLADSGAVAIPEIAEVERLTRSRVTPNPATDAVRIEYATTKAEPIMVRIYDGSGRLIQHISSGEGSVVWDRRDDRGAAVRSGVYFYELRSGDLRIGGRFVLLD